MQIMYRKSSSRENICRSLARLAAAAVCFALLLPGWPVNRLEIVTADEAGEVVFSSPVANGGSFVTTYIHSLQLSPVIDDYRVVGGQLWSWEERTQSHNAGLPFDTPEHGRFLTASPWMIVQGGRRVFGEIVLRIGNERFGQNTWRLPPWDEVEIFRRYPGKRMILRASSGPLGDAKVVRAE